MRVSPGCLEGDRASPFGASCAVASRERNRGVTAITVHVHEQRAFSSMRSRPPGATQARIECAGRRGFRGRSSRERLDFAGTDAMLSVRPRRRGEA